MRITKDEISNLLQSVHQFDKDAKVYLFGSRADDLKKGGDIDIAVLSKKMDFNNKLAIKFRFFQEFGEQKLDIVMINDEEMPFWNAIKQNAKLLSN